MAAHVPIDAQWISADKVWLATSPQWPGLVVEADGWDELLNEIELILPEFLEVQGIDPNGASFTVKVETRQSLSAA
jgi:predicted RNase H-like HicB family nuclease